MSDPDILTNIRLIPTLSVGLRVIFAMNGFSVTKPALIHGNTAIHRFTYEIAPVFVLMEQLTLKKMREMIGWPGGEGDGLFSPGWLDNNTKNTVV